MDSKISHCGRFLIVPTSKPSEVLTQTYAINLTNYDVGLINSLEGDYNWFFPFASYAIVASRKDQHVLRLAWEDAGGYAWQSHLS